MTIETRQLEDFSTIAVSGNAEMVLVQGDTPQVVIEADPEVMEHLKVEVKNGHLELGLHWWLGMIFIAWKPVKYTVTYRQIEALTVSGSVKVRAAHIEAPQFKFVLSGSGTFVIEKLTTETLHATISGSGTLDFSGTVRRQDLHISGSAKVEAWALDSQSASVRVSGSGDLMLKVSNDLDVSISGSGSVRYMGSPRVNQSISGSGSVKQVS
jgi:hypothetical protein